MKRYHSLLLLPLLFLSQGADAAETTDCNGSITALVATMPELPQDLKSDLNQLTLEQQSKKARSDDENASLLIKRQEILQRVLLQIATLEQGQQEQDVENQQKLEAQLKEITACLAVNK